MKLDTREDCENLYWMHFEEGLAQGMEDPSGQAIYRLTLFAGTNKVMASFLAEIVANDLLLNQRGLSYDEANEIVRWFDSYLRLPAMLLLREKMSKETWLRLLGEWWSSCDNIGIFKDELRSALRMAGRPSNLMMSSEEIAVYEQLPDTVTIYRGAGEKNKDGICWSLDKRVAASFPFTNRYKSESPILLTAKIKRKRIVAVKFDRDESEVIACAVRPHKVEKIECIKRGGEIDYRFFPLRDDVTR